MECCRRPNRSDVHLSNEEESKLEEKTRQYFDGEAPKRHTKPQRSEYSTTYVDSLTVNGFIPELAEFQRLEGDPQGQKLIFSGSEATEEFVKTEYYKDLNCIDKQHHRTGTGFIKVDASNKQSFSIAPNGLSDHHTSCKGNPATNDWIPAVPDMVIITSDKPNRSDN